MKYQDQHLVSPRLREDSEPEAIRAAPNADALAISEVNTDFDG